MKSTSKWQKQFGSSFPLQFFLSVFVRLYAIMCLGPILELQLRFDLVKFSPSVTISDSVTCYVTILEDLV